ncbi:hypothetical protein Caci_6573 [Catenulispora acidiphila DSM 44928]|uniref:G domain-containing protein n=1 Tax=Catenulispora acidiphila (strain DSM 44928 / JCM 14897 / NBRC 102108 / NRRL B-24433 / ID139908) TaxID=479433 RepID=C7PYC9_CATAD|nr:hypothetical protein [Catenulispora acidiphila]ACU75419.1 hypothetical protein Caci_6573 [Catenulispora acidiphila DSM 44928]
MLRDLHEPSLGAVRARLIQQELAGGAASRPVDGAVPGLGGEGRGLPLLAATGKTHSGKSTLGNLLVGMAGLLRSTGFQDCTDGADVLRFPRGLRYLDLPGVASSDMLENANRAVLGLPQHPDLTPVHEVRLRGFTPDGPDRTDSPAEAPGAAGTTEAAEAENGRMWPVDRLRTVLPRPDLVFYVVAPHQNLNRAEQPYLADLLTAYGAERVLFVLNMFHRADGTPQATPQNLDDVRRKLDRACRAVGAALKPDRLVALDCRTGEGLDRLLSAAQQILDDDGLLAEVVIRQQQEAPARYRAEVAAAVADYVTQAATLTPGPDGTAHEDLETAANRLLAYARRLGTIPSGFDENRWRTSFRAVAAAAAAELRNEATEPIIERRSRDVTRTETVYDWITETDYSHPVYETRRVRVDSSIADLDDLVTAVKRAWRGERFAAERWESQQVVVGYASIERQVAVGTREVYDHTEHWEENVGTRVTAVYYSPYGAIGPALLLAAWAAALRGRRPGKDLGPASVYGRALQEAVAHSAPGAPTEPWAIFAQNIMPAASVPLWHSAADLTDRPDLPEEAS